MKLEDLADKRVVIWGFGREARAVMRVLEERNIHPNLRVFDEFSTDDSMRDATMLEEAQVIVRSPGVPTRRPELVRAAQRNCVITTATNLWFADQPRNVICVTGTKGKSTTTALIAHLLNHIDIRAEATGNIGVPALDVSDETVLWWVLEISSYQASDLEYSPTIGVLTSLSPEHLDWHGSYENYLNDKISFLKRVENRPVVVNAADAGARNVAYQFKNAILAGGDNGVVAVERNHFVFNGERLLTTNDLSLRGVHNINLACTALTAISVAGIDLINNANRIALALSEFEPLPHRLQVIAEKDGLTYVDDGLSTTPVATKAALEAFGGRPRTIIMGGHDRGLDYEPLAMYMAENRNHVYVLTMPDNGARIAAAMRRARVEVEECEGLEQCVARARQITPPGGVVLLSPGAPSFGRYRNYEDRSNAFADLVLHC